MIVPADSRHERRQVYFRCVPFLVAIALMTVRFPPEVFAAPLPQSDPFESEVSPQFSEIREAIDEDDYEQALRLLTEKRVVAVKVKNQFLLQEILAEIKEVNRLKREFSKVREKAETLKTKPGDPEANEKVGLFYCAEKGDWIAGLNMLSKSGDSGLRQAALDDLKRPETPAHRMKLADAVVNLQQGAGHQFDPVVVAALFAALAEHPDLVAEGICGSDLACLQRYRQKLAAGGSPAAQLFI